MISGSIDDKSRAFLEKCYEKYGKYKIITTVPHTGTHSLLEEFSEYRHWHCSDIVIELIEDNLDNIDVLTTFRKPERVAASWYNRHSQRSGRLNKATKETLAAKWKRYWECYGKILKLVPDIKVFKMDDLKHRLYSHADRACLHSFLDHNNFEDYYKVVDKELINYAYKQIQTGERND